jgi:hypothetical protein
VSFTVVTPDGQTYVMEGEEEAKGNGQVMQRVRREMVYCTFSETFTLEVEEEGFPAGSTVTFSAAVIGFLTGR